jgi:hypothetical protein
MAGFWDTGGGEVFGDGITSIWDRFVVAGRALPGVATVDGAKRVRLDERSASGSDGASLTHQGNDGAQVTVRLRMWTADQVEEWGRREKEFLARAGKSRPKPVVVYHPALAIHGIKSLFVKEVGLLRVQAGGSGEVSIRFVEFLPPAQVGVSTPKAAIQQVPSVLNSPAAGSPPSKRGAGP